MKKTLVAIVFIFASVSYSQISLQLGPMLGLTNPTVDYSGETTSFYNGTGYGLRSGLNYGALAKVKLGPLNGRLSINYSKLSNSGKGDPNGNNSTLEIENSLFLVTLGTELGFGVPLAPIRPYIGVDILFSSISGSFKFQGTSGVTSDSRSIQSASRTGLGLAVGSEIGLGSRVKIDASLRYNLHNLFGKEYTVITNSNRVDAYTSLNDAKDPNYSTSGNDHPIGNDRTIATIQLQLGILFGF